MQGTEVTVNGTNNPVGRKRQGDSFTLTITARRIYESSPLWQEECLEVWLNQALGYMDVDGSHVCRPLDEPEQWYQGEGYMIGMHINEGVGNWDLPVICCR